MSSVALSMDCIDLIENLCEIRIKSMIYKDIKSDRLNEHLEIFTEANIILIARDWNNQNLVSLSTIFDRLKNGFESKLYIFDTKAFELNFGFLYNVALVNRKTYSSSPTKNR